MKSEICDTVLKILKPAAMAGAVFLSSFATAVFADSCPPPLEVDLQGRLLPSEKEAMVNKLEAMVAGANNAIFSGSLQQAPLGPLESRPEYVWTLAKQNDQRGKGILGHGTVNIGDAYRFDGVAIMRGRMIELRDVPVQFNMFCIVDAVSDCSPPLPVGKGITFGGVLFETPNHIMKDGSICADYLENETVLEFLNLSEVEESREIWGAN